MLAILSMLMPLVDKVVARIPDPAARERAALDMQAELLKAAVAESNNQAEINKVEAANPNIFVSGWRPFIGWVGAIGLAYSFLIYPVLSWFLIVFGVTNSLPKPDNDTLMALVYAMLGIGAMRSFDKWKGTSR
jgi:hypothetical protein